MKKFWMPAVPILAALLSCGREGGAYKVDFRGDIPSGASTYFEAMLQPSGKALVSELEAGDSALVYFASATCGHCERIEEPLSKAVAASGLAVNLVYARSSLDASDPDSDYSIVRSYLSERYGNEDIGRYTPWLYYVTPEEAVDVLPGTGSDTSEDYYRRLLTSNFSSTGVVRHVAPSPLDEDVLSVLVDSEEEGVYSSYLEQIKKRAIEEGKTVAFYDYAALKEEDPLAFCEEFSLVEFENAVHVGGVSYPFPSADAATAIAAYFD